MQPFHVDCIVENTQLSEKMGVVKGLLVGTGAQYTWIPTEHLREAGVPVAKKDLAFTMANGQVITRSVGYAILRVGEFETVDEVVFGQPGDLRLLGARTLEGFPAVIDARRKRLVAAGPLPAAP